MGHVPALGLLETRQTGFERYFLGILFEPAEHAVTAPHTLSFQGRFREGHGVLEKGLNYRVFRNHQSLTERQTRRKQRFGGSGIDFR